MNNVISVTDETFDDLIANSDRPVLVDFYADWCGPCRTQAPVLERWAQAHAGTVTVAKVNVDVAPEAARTWQVRSIPTLHLFVGGQLVGTRVGVQSERELNGLLDAISESA